MFMLLITQVKLGCVQVGIRENCDVLLRKEVSIPFDMFLDVIMFGNVGGTRCIICISSVIRSVSSAPADMPAPRTVDVCRMNAIQRSCSVVL